MSLGPRLETLKQLLWSEVNMELHYSVNKFWLLLFLKSLLSGLSMARKMSSAKSSRLLTFDVKHSPH